MKFEIREPNEKDDVSCHLQQIGMGTLICRAAKQTGGSSTNETNPTVCFSCLAGRIYREIGCDAIIPKLKLFSYGDDISIMLENLFCRIRKRNTNMEYCKTCGLVVAETTRENISTARGLFERQKFYTAYQDLETARKDIRDGNFENAITRSISCLESVMHICHEKLNKPLPNKMQVTGLWKSTREILKFDEVDITGSTNDLLNALSGVIVKLGGLRNSLSDAHGNGLDKQDITESIAELAINVSATLSTMILRRFNQLKEENNE